MLIAFSWSIASSGSSELSEWHEVYECTDVTSMGLSETNRRSYM
jgi:hypothetical protein